MQDVVMPMLGTDFRNLKVLVDPENDEWLANIPGWIVAKVNAVFSRCDLAQKLIEELEKQIIPNKRQAIAALAASKADAALIIQANKELAEMLLGAEVMKRDEPVIREWCRRALRLTGNVGGKRSEQLVSMGTKESGGFGRPEAGMTPRFNDPKPSVQAVAKNGRGL